MDIIGQLFQKFYDATYELPPPVFYFVLRAVLLFGLPCAFCYTSFLRGNRSLLIQWLWCVGGFLIASVIPVHAIRIEHRLLKAWVVVLSIVLLIFLPAMLPNFLTPTLGAQRLFRVINYLSL